MFDYRWDRNPNFSKLLVPRNATPDTTPENSDTEDTTSSEASMEVQVDEDEWTIDEWYNDEIEYINVLSIECNVEILNCQ